MYKNKKMAFIFFTIALLGLSTYAQGSQNGGVTYSVGYQKIPGRNFQPEWTLNYVAGVLKTTNVLQLDENMGLSCYMIRINQMGPFLVNKNILAGIEIGCGSSNTYRKNWSLPANPAGALINRELTYSENTVLDTASTKSHGEETAVTVIPLLGRIAYNIPIGNIIGIKVDLGIGNYIINVKQTLKDALTDRIKENTSNYTLFLPASELAIGIGFKMSDSASLEFSGSLSMLAKKSIMSESILTSSPTGGSSAYPDWFKDGFLFGGTAYGVNGGIILSF